MSDKIIRTNYEQALNEYDAARQAAEQELEDLRAKVTSGSLTRVEYNEFLPGISRKVEPFKARYEQALKTYRESGLDLENTFGE